MKKYLITGLLVWLPLAITIWVLLWVLGLMDGLFAWLLSGSQAVLPEACASLIEMLRHVPGLGVVVLLLVLLLTGLFAANIFGQWFAAPMEPPAAQDPDRQVDLQLGQAGVGHAVLEQRQRVSRGRAGAVPARRLVDHRLRHRHARRRGGRAPASAHLSVYVPTTPNPTSGFFLMMPRADVIPLAMSVDEALKYVISMGVVAPGLRRRRRASPQPCETDGLSQRASGPQRRRITLRIHNADPSSPCRGADRSDQESRSAPMRTTYCGLSAKR